MAHHPLERNRKRIASCVEELRLLLGASLEAGLVEESEARIANRARQIGPTLGTFLVRQIGRDLR
jgi:hypothetical protein